MRIDLIVLKIVSLRQFRRDQAAAVRRDSNVRIVHSAVRQTHCFELEVSYDRRQGKPKFQKK